MIMIIISSQSLTCPLCLTCSISSFVQPRCVLPTCLTVNLGSSLQGGDEKAGGATSDPFGIGKK
uniref:Uncharacterized protein n=1 Tax=Lates calcarifer TaxID=8187 RepID=A0A4W6DFT1_LATCA